jgi:pimeloyl-ACP methyl ester carboxylesterase
MAPVVRDEAGHSFDSSGVRIAYDDVGEGPPVVLVHGFASNRRANWREPGWYDALVDAGRRVIALDCRGHGESGTPHDPDAYGIGVMAVDVVRLLDHLGVEEADVVGYSMGGRIAVRLLVDHPDRVNAAVLGGVGEAILSGPPDQSEIVEALEAEDPSAVEHPAGRRFRAFAERMDGDLQALAATMRAIPTFDLPRLSDVAHPVLVVAGENDSVVGDPAAFADSIEGAESVVVPERNHMTTVGDPRFVEAVVVFLDRTGL